MNELALFAGAGGGILGGKLLGWRTICAVERDAYAAQVLAQRQNDGILEAFPIWSDVTTFDGRPWRGLVDVISGGFPCQDISAAGKGAGITGARSSMWKEMARIVSEVQPRYVFVENSPMLTIRGLGVVLGDLAAMGFDAEWGVLSAADVGANHRRERIWILGHSNSSVRRNSRGERVEGNLFYKTQWQKGANQAERSSFDGTGKMANSMCNSIKRFIPCGIDTKEWKRQVERQIRSCGDGNQWWSTEPEVGRVADGVAYRVDRLKSIGNGQVPLCAATAFELLKARFE